MINRILLLFFLFLGTHGVYAQEIGSVEDEDPFKDLTMEEMKERAVFPSFAGGDIKKFLKKNLIYPEEARNNGFQGRVVVSFVVEKDGSLSQFSAHDCTVDVSQVIRKIRKLSPEQQHDLKEKVALMFAKEGVRVLKQMKTWIPGTLDGSPVRIKLSLPITFRFSW